MYTIFTKPGSSLKNLRGLYAAVAPAVPSRGFVDDRLMVIENVNVDGKKLSLRKFGDVRRELEFGKNYWGYLTSSLVVVSDRAEAIQYLVWKQQDFSALVPDGITRFPEGVTAMRAQAEEHLQRALAHLQIVYGCVQQVEDLS